MALSTFVWNEVIFRSFKAGNLKGIDFELWKSLESSIAKRLYRFLDKRFYHRKRWAFDLKELCWERLGLARTHDAANLKRKLRPALAELERADFIKPAAKEKRFQRVCSGEWRMTVESPKHVPTENGDIAASVSPRQEELQAELIKRGISLAKAAEIVTAYPLEQVANQMEMFDWLLARQDPKVSRNPAGFLVSSIRNQYSAPTDFQNARATQQHQEREKERERHDEEKREEREKQAVAQDRKRAEMIAQFWASMSDKDRARHQERAIESASRFDRDLLQKSGRLGTIGNKRIMDAYALAVLGKT